MEGSSSSNEVDVSALPALNNSKILKYFQSKRQSEGGECEESTRLPGGGVRLRFKEREEPFSTIKVEKMENADTEFVSMYFESERRSGGGDIATVEEEKKYWVITFADPAVAERVLKQKHIIKGTEVVCSEFIITSAKPREESLDPRRILLSGFAGPEDKDTLKMFIENCSKTEEFDIEDTDNISYKVVTFVTDIGKLNPLHSIIEKAKQKAHFHSHKTLDFNILRFFFATFQWPAQDSKELLMIEPDISKSESHYVVLKNWPKTIQEEMKLFFDKYSYSSEKVDSQIFDVLASRLLKYEKDTIEITSDRLNNQVHIVGLKSDVNVAMEQLSALNEKLTSEVEISKNNKQMELVVKQRQFDLIKQNGFDKRIGQIFPDVTIQLDLGKKSVVLEGPKDDCAEMYSKLVQLTMQFSEKYWKASSKRKSFLLHMNHEDFVQNTFIKHGIEATIGEIGGDIMVIGASDENLITAVSALENAITETVVKFEHNFDIKQHSTDWENFVGNLNNSGDVSIAGAEDVSFKIHCDKQEGKEVVIVGLRGVTNDVGGKIKQFISDFSTETVFIPLRSNGVLNYIDKFCDLSNQLPAISKIKKGESDQTIGYTVTLKAKDKDEVIKHFDDLSTSIVSKMKCIKKPGGAKFLHERGTIFLDSLEVTHKVIIILDPAEEQQEEESQKANHAEVVHKTSMNGISVSIQKGKMQLQCADAMVITVDEHLQSVGYLAKMLVDVGGPAIQSERDRKVASNGGPFNAGDAVLTGAGMLPCKFLINMVGVKWDDQLAMEKMDKFKQAVTKSIERSVEKQCKSIAIPTLNSEETAKQQGVALLLNKRMKGAWELQLQVFSNKEENIDKVFEMIETKLSTEETEREIKDPLIQEFSPEEFDEINALQNKYQVIIKIDASVGLKIQGNIADVSHVVVELHKIMNDVRLRLATAKEEELLAKTVKWVYLDRDNEEYVAFSKSANIVIEKAYLQKQKTISIKDRKAFVEFNRNELSYEDGPTLKIKRKNTLDVIPSDWVDEAEFRGHRMITVELKSRSRNYQEVERHFKQSLGKYSHNPGFTIEEIIQIQNPVLWKLYATKKSEMDIANKGSRMEALVERILYHGTAHGTCETINTNGFNRSYCGKNAVVYGNGVYFAVNASYSAHNKYSPPDANGSKWIYRARVLTGDYTLGTKGMIEPPPRDRSVSSALLYDSVTDDKNPEVFVIFNDTQAYPEYLIKFKLA
ncbi:unnamed protein product [Lampetra planeri]